MKRQTENRCLFVCCNKEYTWNEREKKVFSLLMTVNALLKPQAAVSLVQVNVLKQVLRL